MLWFTTYCVVSGSATEKQLGHRTTHPDLRSCRINTKQTYLSCFVLDFREHVFHGFYIQAKQSFLLSKTSLCTRNMTGETISYWKNKRRPPHERNAIEVRTPHSRSSLSNGLSIADCVIVGPERWQVRKSATEQTYNDRLLSVTLLRIERGT